TRDNSQQQVETISHRLPTKRGGDIGHGAPSASAASATAAAAAQGSHAHGNEGHGSGRGHRHSVGSGAASAPSKSTMNARKHAVGAKEKPGSEKTYNFQWDEEFLLPGVSDSATIVFTILHQAPTRVVCLGQVLVEPRAFTKNEEHVRTVSLAKQQVMVSSGPQQRGAETRIANADCVKPGKFTFTIRKSSYCDGHCSEMNGPIVEEVNTLAQAESQAGGRLEDPALTAAASPASKDINAHKHKRSSHGGKRSHTPEPANTAPVQRSSLGTTGRAATESVHMKSGDLSTVWWVCVWQGRLRIFRRIGDAHAKLVLPLDRWSLEPEALPTEDEISAKTMMRRDLKLFSAHPKRWIVFRCATRADKIRWEEVIARNKAGLTRRTEPLPT
ncbi:unnamed protein product, partial [Pylaiella littoralis]